MNDKRSPAKPGPKRWTGASPARAYSLARGLDRQRELQDLVVRPARSNDLETTRAAILGQRAGYDAGGLLAEIDRDVEPGPFSPSFRPDPGGTSFPLAKAGIAVAGEIITSSRPNWLHPHAKFRAKSLGGNVVDRGKLFDDLDCLARPASARRSRDWR